MAYKKMDKKVKNVWLKALRSGKYRQGEGYLCKQDKNNKSRYCCLGVLCNESHDGDWNREDDDYDGFVNWSIGGRSGAIPENIAKGFGLNLRTQEKLVALNDGEKLNFKEIAEWIEKNL